MDSLIFLGEKYLGSKGGVGSTREETMKLHEKHLKFEEEADVSFFYRIFLLHSFRPVF